MKTILIPTMQSDAHAACVALVLKQMGHRPVRWFCQDLPEAATASFHIGSADPRVAIREGVEPPVDLSEVDVLWNRRVEPRNHQEPRGAPEQSSGRQERAHEVRAGIDAHVFQSDVRGESVRRRHLRQQAATAAMCPGARTQVPETLVSNNPEAIKAFLGEHQASGTIFKSFRPVHWDEGDVVAAVHTHQVSVDMLPPDPFLQLSPGDLPSVRSEGIRGPRDLHGGRAVFSPAGLPGDAQGKLDWRLEDP